MICYLMNTGIALMATLTSKKEFNLATYYMNSCPRPVLRRPVKS